MLMSKVRRNTDSHQTETSIWLPTAGLTERSILLRIMSVRAAAPVSAVLRDLSSIRVPAEAATLLVAICVDIEMIASGEISDIFITILLSICLD